MAVFPVSAELSRGRRVDAGTWCSGQLRDDPSWCVKFGQAYANQLRRWRPRPGDKWHLDEVFVKINGTTYYLWRAVDQHGNVLDILVQSGRNAAAGKRFFRCVQRVGG